MMMHFFVFLAATSNHLINISINLQTLSYRLGKGHTYRDDVGMFFPTDYYVTTILPIFSLGCEIGRAHV